jgi:glucokinase
LTHAGRPIEEFVSRRALRRAYRDQAADDVDVAAIAQRARRGDQLAGQVFDEAMAVLGQVIAPWLASFSAEALVIGGAIARSWDLLEAGLRRGLVRAGLDPDSIAIAPGTPDDDIAAIGAALAVRP